MIFNENGMIINNQNTWMENVNRDINELNSIIESIQIDYLHEGFNLKEAASKFAAKVKKIFEWIKQKLKEVKNWIKSKFDPLINKIKNGKDKIVNNFKKLSKEQKEKLFKKNNSVNESYYLHESSSISGCKPEDIVRNFEIISRIYGASIKENDTEDEAKMKCDKQLKYIKKVLIGNDEEDFSKNMKDYFYNLYDECSELDINEIIDIAINGHESLSQMEKLVDQVEKEFINQINELELQAKDGKIFNSYHYDLKYFLYPVMQIINTYAPMAIKYIETVISASGRICAQLLRNKLNWEEN